MPFSNNTNWLSHIDCYVKNWLWRPRRLNNSTAKWSWIILKTLYLTLRNAYLDRLPFQASALTFMTLLSLVPALAISFSFAKGVGCANELEKFLLSNEFTISQAEILSQIVGYVQRTHIETLGVVGIIILLVLLVLTLSSVEQTFNQVWKVRSQRSWLRKFANSLSMLVIAPLITLATATIWAGISSLEVVQWFKKLPVLGLMANWGMNLGPLILLAAAFIFIYFSLPNITIPLWSAIIAGLVAAILWWIVQNLYIYFQFGVARYNVIYGGFILFPLFLVWLQVNWMILLFGNELAYAFYLQGAMPIIP